ncbi:hypothetical protein SLA2020_341480 [Shorea laevis]
MLHLSPRVGYCQLTQSNFYFRRCWRIKFASFFRHYFLRKSEHSRGVAGRNTQLKKLIIDLPRSELEEYPGLISIHQLRASLKSSTLYGWDKLKSLPHQLQHLTALNFIFEIGVSAPCNHKE